MLGIWSGNDKSYEIKNNFMLSRKSSAIVFISGMDVTGRFLMIEAYK